MSKRRFVTSEQKIAILREHLIDKVSVSDLCDKHRIRPVLFYNWQRQLFEDGSMVFERKAKTANKKRQDDTPDPSRSSSSKPNCRTRMRC